jgi:hypothetical protein
MMPAVMILQRRRASAKRAKRNVFVLQSTSVAVFPAVYVAPLESARQYAALQNLRHARITYTN